MIFNNKYIKRLLKATTFRNMNKSTQTEYYHFPSHSRKVNVHSAILSHEDEGNFQGITLKMCNTPGKIIEFILQITTDYQTSPIFVLEGSTTSQVINYYNGNVLTILKETGHKATSSSLSDISQFYHYRTLHSDQAFIVVGSAFDGIGVVSAKDLRTKVIEEWPAEVLKFVNTHEFLTDNLFFVDTYSISPRPIYKYAFGAIEEIACPTQDDYTIFIDCGGSGPKCSIFNGLEDVTKKTQDFPKNKIPTNSSGESSEVISSYNESLHLTFYNIQEWLSNDRIKNDPEDWVHHKVKNIIILFTGKIREIYYSGSHMKEIEKMTSEFKGRFETYLP